MQVGEVVKIEGLPYLVDDHSIHRGEKVVYEDMPKGHEAHTASKNSTFHLIDIEPLKRGDVCEFKVEWFQLKRSDRLHYIYRIWRFRKKQ